MIEFGTKRSGNGKKSRFCKKFPRKKIAKVGEKAANWFKNNWKDDSYPYFGGDLCKFLLSNIGRPVDKVFSEFLDRCRTSAKRYNLKQQFYDIFEEKENIGYKGGFYLTNGIINYKKRRKFPCSNRPISTVDLNKKLIPKNLNEICRKCEETHKMQYLGEFWVAYGVLKRVYIIERKVWEDAWIYDHNIYKLTLHYRKCCLWGVGSGINRYSWVAQDKQYPRTVYELVNPYDLAGVKSDIIFIIKR